MQPSILLTTGNTLLNCQRNVKHRVVGTLPVSLKQGRDRAKVETGLNGRALRDFGFCGISDIVTDPKSLALVVSAAIITMVVLDFILRPIWQSWHE